MIDFTVVVYLLIASVCLNGVLIFLLFRKRFRYKKLRRQRFEKRIERIMHGEYLMSTR